MQLLEKLKPQKRNGKQLEYYGKFLCDFCQKEVEKPLHAGIKYKSCGCQQTPKGENNPNIRCGATPYLLRKYGLDGLDTFTEPCLNFFKKQAIGCPKLPDKILKQIIDSKDPFEREMIVLSYKLKNPNKYPGEALI